MKLKTALANLTLIAVSAGLSLVLCEFLARLFLNPADYLSVEMSPDNVLGAAPAAGSGLDKMGFRNPSVPATADIVALGDSHTYGNSARMEDSWPSVLGRLTGRTVYNMGLGGYGPNQYFHLLPRALRLKPRTVLCGLYMGDDFENAFLITYGLDHWAYLRRLPAGKVPFYIWQSSRTEVSWHKKVRNWLAGHSVAYQVVVHGPAMGLLHGEVRIRNASRLSGAAVTLAVPEANILEAFLPNGPLRNLDQASEGVREGMRITFELIKQMKELCAGNQVQFVVVMIPTKESVFSEYLERTAVPPHRDVLMRLIANERLARRKTFEFLTDAGIPYVDTLSSMQRAVGRRLYARSAADMHPGRNGYRVIAEAVSEVLQPVETRAK